MSLEQASLIAQVVSAVAILASLVFLAGQIQDNTRAMRSQSYFNGLAHGQRPFELMIQDGDLSRIVNAGYMSPDSLSDEERERFYFHTFLLFNAWEYFFYQQKDGSIPPQLFLGSDAHMRRLIRDKPGLGPFWTAYRHAYTDPFLTYVSDIIAGKDGQACPVQDSRASGPTTPAC